MSLLHREAEQLTKDTIAELSIDKFALELFFEKKLATVDDLIC